MNPVLNALVAVDPEGAERAAAASAARWRAGQPLGPLDGVPLTVKDSLNVAGVRDRLGQPALRGGEGAGAGRRPRRDTGGAPARGRGGDLGKTKSRS